ncbi:MAG TPA: type IV pilus assembly protein PilM [Armatimonadota bacterium]|nr:type IV pilus assembly protein PilM [Armatimonadota bacterium]
MLSQLFGKDTVVGIDIGNSHIKAVEVEPCGTGFRLVNAALQVTPLDSCRDGVITNIPDVAQAIRTLLRSANIRSTGAVAAISGSQVIVRQVQLPKMSEASLRKSIRFEAAKYVSASMDDSVVEFEILGDVEGTDQMNVMLVAAPKDLVESRVSVLEAAGVEPIAIDVEAFAIIRALVDCNKTQDFTSKTIALVDMGASHTDVNIVSGGTFALTRSIPIAGESFTNAIKTLTGFSYDDAERMKFEMALQESIDKLSSGDVESKCWRVVQPLLDELLREIRRSIHYYQSQFPEGAEQASVSEVVLTGGTARMPGMAAYVSSKLNVPVEIGDAWSKNQISLGRFTQDFADDYGPVLVVGTGLALKEEMTRAKQRPAA